MNLRLLLGAVSVGCALFALLAVWRVPGVLGWKLALMATEFGHWIALLPIVLGAMAVVGATGGARVGLLILNTMALGFLLSPSLRAMGIATRADAAWKRSSLAARASRESSPSFLWATLWSRTTPPLVPGETYVFAETAGAHLQLDFFRADRARAGRPGAAPCVIIVHGGGWDSGERAQLPELNAVLVDHGFAVATIDYRLVPRWRWPAPREDVESALRWLREHSAQLGIARDQFVLLGRSAGGQIALATGYRLGSAEIRGVISLYGPADLRFAYEHGTEGDTLRSPALLRAYLGGTPEEVTEVYNDASAYLIAGAGTPPTLLLHGAGDTLVWHRQSERLAEKLAAAGTPHCFISLTWATHAFDYNLHGPGGQIARASILRFLAAVTSQEETKSGGR